MDIFKQFDSYAMQARIYPALLTLLPGLATILAWFPSLLTSNVGSALLAVINSCGLLFLLAEVSRSQGQRVQRSLLQQWDVMPSTRVLRHGDGTLPAEVKARYHRYLAAKLGGGFPTAAEEKADAKTADEKYGSAILWLKEQCRGSEHSLLLKENTSYGFRRNLLGLKLIGVAICVVAIVGPLATVWLTLPSQLAWRSVLATFRALEAIHIGALTLSLIALCSWVFVIRCGWVKESADLYAIRLLAACDRS